ncbi:TMV resistance protein N [Artemisia annua]|uniref:TMV resistance protein N n=1 Tax=Artemisia annua TaxID=35608 RepID=A0A2U1QAC2_ARTAN|nr:TMV resistance protein N [Artemisia annua]
MSSLRFIQLLNYELQWSSSSNDDMPACFSFKHLKYLEWEWFPCKSLDNIDMGNVVIIKLRDSKLEKLWEGANKSCKKLKHLDVTDSSSLTKIGNFIGLENLEELYLEYCLNLEELDSSIGCLQKLVELHLSGCTLLKSLPWEIGSLISLQRLDLDRNRFNKLPNSLCQLHQLIVIYLFDCTNLKSIPDLPLNIEFVQANGCINLVNLPSNCSELQFLTCLDLDNCSKLGYEGFTQVTRLRNLQNLYMANCNISQVSSGIGNLVSLRVLRLSKNTFSSLPDSFSNLSKLEDLYISHCSELQLLPPLPSQLKIIAANECRSLDVMPFDSMQKAYTFRSKVFKESLMNTKGLYIGLSGEELPEWCTYGNGGNVLSFEAPIRFDSKICGLILCATTSSWPFSTIHNKTKEKSHRIETIDHIITSYSSLQVMFYPFNDKTVVVEAGDTVVLRLDRFTSCGLHLVYEDDVADSGLVLKGVCSFPIQDVMILSPWYLNFKRFTVVRLYAIIVGRSNGMPSRRLMNVQ